MTACASAAVRDPFALDDSRAYLAWRERKLATLPRSAQDLVVEIDDPAALSVAERGAIVQRCRDTNVALYAFRRPCRDDAGAAAQVHALGRQLGLHRLDHNWLAGEDGISALRVGADRSGPGGEYIPYTDRPIRWHTDGYYNAPERRIHAMLLHCVEPAASGGENRLLDHELSYLQLRDIDPAHIAALSASDAMTIPARLADSPGQERFARAEQTGPVFLRHHASGALHMRYTARTRSIAWKPDSATQAAERALRALLENENPFVLRVRLTAGMGIVCNNVLHERSGFVDSGSQRRLVLRARYHDRVGG